MLEVEARWEMRHGLKRSLSGWDWNPLNGHAAVYKSAPSRHQEPTPLITTSPDPFEFFHGCTLRFQLPEKVEFATTVLYVLFTGNVASKRRNRRGGKPCFNRKRAYPASGIRKISHPEAILRRNRVADEPNEDVVWTAIEWRNDFGVNERLDAFR
jgi:hypothetical protein